MSWLGHQVDGTTTSAKSSHTSGHWGGGGANWCCGIKRHILLCIRWVSYKGILYSSGDYSHQVSSVQLLSHVQLFVTPRTAACQASLSISSTNSWSLLKLMSTESVMPSNHLTFVIPFSSHLQSSLESGFFFFLFK